MADSKHHCCQCNSFKPLHLFVHKSDLTDAFCHVVTATGDTRLLSLTLNGWFFMETGLTFGGHSTPWLFNLFTEAMHWVLQSTTSHPIKHYLDDFFGVVLDQDNPACPLHHLALICCTLGMQLAPNKTLWNKTCLEILGIEVNTVSQTVRITNEQHQCILSSIDLLLTRCSTCLINWLRIVGLLQFVSQVVPHAKAYLHHLYNASKAAYHHPMAL